MPFSTAMTLDLLNANIQSSYRKRTPSESEQKAAHMPGISFEAPKKHSNSNTPYLSEARAAGTNIPYKTNF